MKMKELTACWVEETERIARLVKDEFMPLNEQQLAYRVHVDHCNIRQIMQQVHAKNSSMLALIEGAMPYAASNGAQEEYHPGVIGRTFLKRMASAGCSTENRKNQEADARELAAGNLFLEIIEQQSRIRELVTLCKTVDMNSRVVPFRLHGLIRLSLAEAFEYMVVYQKRRFVMARHLLMLA